MLELRLGRSFIEGPDAWHRRWSFDRPTVFENIRILDPRPKTSIVEPALREIVSIYPELAGIAGGADLGGMDRFQTPDAVPVISPSMPCRASWWRRASAATASASRRPPGGWRRTSRPAHRRWSTPRPSR